MIQHAQSESSRFYFIKPRIFIVPINLSPIVYILYEFLAVSLSREIHRQQDSVKFLPVLMNSHHYAGSKTCKF